MSITNGTDRWFQRHRTHEEANWLMNGSETKPAKEHVDEFLTAPQLAFMKKLVVVLGLIFIAMFIALIFGLIYKADELSKSSTPQTVVKQTSGGQAGGDRAGGNQADRGKAGGGQAEGTLSAAQILSHYKSMGVQPFRHIPLPAGSLITASNIVGDTIVLTIRDHGGYALMTVDANTLKVIGIARLSTAASKPGVGN